MTSLICGSSLELRELSDGTKKNYRDDLRLRVRPQFEHFSLGEITTGRVEWFLRSENAVSPSRAHHSRTVLNQLFGFALRHDAIPRNPVQGTSPLRRPKGARQALTVEQINAIRDAAGLWRTGPDVEGPKPDGQVRDIIEVLLGTALRIGECLALRVCDVEDGPRGMTISVTGTAEEVNNLYKTELIRQRGPWRTVEQVELATLEWVWWWNNSRLHGELDMRTPLEVEQAYYADQESAQPAPAGQSSQ